MIYRQVQVHHQIALMYLWYLLELPEIWARGRVQLHLKIALMKIISIMRYLLYLMKMETKLILT